jgi:hypothetical protein
LAEFHQQVGRAQRLGDWTQGLDSRLTASVI